MYIHIHAYTASTAWYSTGAATAVTMGYHRQTRRDFRKPGKSGIVGWSHLFGAKILKPDRWKVQKVRKIVFCFVQHNFWPTDNIFFFFWVLLVVRHAFCYSGNPESLRNPIRPWCTWNGVITTIPWSLGFLMIRKTSAFYLIFFKRTNSTKRTEIILYFYIVY